MTSHELDTKITLVKAGNRVIESKKQPGSQVHSEAVGELTNLLANMKGAVEIFSSLQQER